MMLNENKETNSKYNINPEDNIPVEIYGIPDYMLNKYDVKPEDNIPQRVYGIPNTNKKKKKKCPYCGHKFLEEINEEIRKIEEHERKKYAQEPLS